MAEVRKFRRVLILQTYFQSFFETLNRREQSKIIWTFALIEEIERVPETYLKHIENSDGLYEIRVQAGGNIFRIFCFFNRDQLVVVGNGFQKKSQKTPRKQLELAQKIKREYEKESYKDR